MKRHHALIALCSVLVLAGSLAGCDPKFPNGVSDNTNGGVGGGGDEGPLNVAVEAQAAGAIVAFQAELITAALTVSASYDSGGAGVRSFLDTGCTSIAVADTAGPVYSLAIDGCTDGNGSTYSGAARIRPFLDGTDGYFLIPDSALETAIAVRNVANDALDHTYSSGSLQIGFERDTGNTVVGVTVSNFLRHFIGDVPDVGFTWIDVYYGGGIGQHAQYPDQGGIVRVSWDTVGIFDLVFQGGASATFRLNNLDYRVNLDTGAVTFVAS